MASESSHLSEDTVDRWSAFASENRSLLIRRAHAIRNEIVTSRAKIELDKNVVKRLEKTLAILEEFISTFTQFHRLPMELQLRIWMYAAREPVVVRLDNVFRKPFPAIFHTCQNARRIALKECSPRFVYHEPGPYDNITEDVLTAIRSPLSLFAGLRYIELEGLSLEFENGYAHHQTTILKAIPGLEKLVLHRSGGGMLEYYSAKSMRDDENLLQFWRRKRGPWNLFHTPFYNNYKDDRASENMRVWIAEYLEERCRLVQAVDDGLFCDATQMPSSFIEEQASRIEVLREGDTRGWIYPIQLVGSPSPKPYDFGDRIIASGIMFPTSFKGMVWNGFTEWRKDLCWLKAEKASQADRMEQREIEKSVNEVSNT